MAFDGIFTQAMMNELIPLLQGGRINKIHQPYNHEIILLIRGKGKNVKLLLSAHPTYGRVQLTNERYENPNEPPMFCMFLRKHLEGAIIEQIRQVGLDRILIFEMKGKNEIGDVTYKQLIVEIMGRHSNIILVDKETNKILESIKHISHAVNSYRAILPGQEYIFPPDQNKVDPFYATEEDILKRIDFNSGKLDRQLVSQFQGLSPLLAKEICFQAGLANRVTLPKKFVQYMEKVKKGEIIPTIMETDKKDYFYIFPLEHIDGEKKHFSSLSEMLDRYYYEKANRDRVKQQAHDLERIVRNEKEKNEKKIKKLQQTLEEAKQKDQYKLYGELLTSYLFQVKKGMESIELINFYDEEGGTVTIPLDKDKSPSENAQKYFTKYQKAKNALIMAEEQIKIAEEEISYLESILQQIESASPEDIEEIREELEEEGYLRKRRKRGKKKKDKPNIDQFISSDGTLIYVGKNNKQNEYLTHRLAKKDHIWLHTKDIPGSHVVIFDGNPSETTLKEAAELAAYFSKGRDSSSVPVDYTKIRYVKKPRGAKPGFVIYENQQTIYITPNEETVIALKKENHQKS